MRTRAYEMGAAVPVPTVEDPAAHVPLAVLSNGRIQITASPWDVRGLIDLREYVLPQQPSI